MFKEGGRVWLCALLVYVWWCCVAVASFVCLFCKYEWRFIFYGCKMELVLTCTRGSKSCGCVRCVMMCCSCNVDVVYSFFVGLFLGWVSYTPSARALPKIWRPCLGPKPLTKTTRWNAIVCSHQNFPSFLTCSLVHGVELLLADGIGKVDDCFLIFFCFISITFR